MIKKNFLLIMTCFINLSLFSMEQVANNAMMKIDFKKYNFTKQEEKVLKYFGIEKDNKSNEYKVIEPRTVFTCTYENIEQKQLFDPINQDAQKQVRLNFKTNLNFFENLPLSPPKIQHCVKTIYYVQLCNMVCFAGGEYSKHLAIVDFSNNIAFYAPQANLYNPENNVVHNRNTHSQSLECALFSVMIIMCFGTGHSLLMLNQESFYKSLEWSCTITCVFLAYSLLKG